MFFHIKNYTNSQNSIISFEYVDFYAKIIPILYPSLKTRQPVLPYYLVSHTEKISLRSKVSKIQKWERYCLVWSPQAKTIFNVSDIELLQLSRKSCWNKALCRYLRLHIGTSEKQFISCKLFISYCSSVMAYIEIQNLFQLVHQCSNQLISKWR